MAGGVTGHVVTGKTTIWEGVVETEGGVTGFGSDSGALTRIGGLHSGSLSQKLALAPPWVVLCVRTEQPPVRRPTGRGVPCGWHALRAGWRDHQHLHHLPLLPPQHPTILQSRAGANARAGARGGARAGGEFGNHSATNFCAGMVLQGFFPCCQQG